MVTSVNNINASSGGGGGGAVSHSSVGSDMNNNERRPRRDRADRKKNKTNRRPSSSVNTLVFNPFFILLFGLLIVSCSISFFLVFSHPEGFAQTTGGSGSGSGSSDTTQKIPPKPSPREDMMQHRLSDAQQEDAIMHGYDKKKIVAAAAAAAAEAEAGGDDGEGDDGESDGDDGEGDDEEGVKEKIVKEKEIAVAAVKPTTQKIHQNMANHQPKLAPIITEPTPFDTTLTTPHLVPKVPPLPVFSEVANSELLIDDLVLHNKPTIAGLIAFFNRYIGRLHEQNKRNSKVQSRDATGQDVDEMYLINSYFELTMKEVEPLESAYRGRTIFPVREDESLYISLAAFREHLLGKSLMSAFDQAEHPDKLFFGAVVQNCFGLDGTVCKTGLEVIGKDKNGRDMTSVSPKPPDENGIEEFCNHENYKKYCTSGQIRVLYVHDTDALGPQTARFYASKLWGGETYFMQMDAHLEFAPSWDKYYIDEARASKNFPKSVLSAYPPGFQEYDGAYKGGSPGARLCSAEFATSPVEHHILRIGMSGNTPRDAKFPTQIPFIAAGFFFAHASFLVDVPFDPYAPWCFMGEEIALSLRAWTNGWNIYAPRKNMIAHQYRPGRLGIPKFWESVGRDSGRGSLNTRLQKHVLRRVKHMLGYPTDSLEEIAKDGDNVALSNFEYYSMGHERTLEDYLEWTKIDVVNQKTGKMGWCHRSELA